MTLTLSPPETAPTVADTPLVVDPPVFFMHIAKTAGSYLNHVLKDALGPDIVETHVEHELGGANDLRRMIQDGRRVISGHVMNGLWEVIAPEAGIAFRKVTIVRDPIAHLASHLLWLDHYNQPEYREDYRLLDETHQRIADRIGAVDLSDIGHLDHYLTTLRASEIRLFDNCQSRYFLANGRGDPDVTRPLSLADARALRRAAAGFDLILCQDNLDAGITDLSTLLKVPLNTLSGRVNEGRATRSIDVANPMVRQVLSRRTLLDQWLWRLVKGCAP